MLAKKLLALAAALCLAIFIFGCSDDDSSTNGGDTPGPTEGSIGPDGDTLEVIGQLKLIVPPGALTDTIDFTVTHNTSPASPPGSMGLVTNCYKIEPSATTFDPPATLILNYSDPSLNGADEMSIDMYTNDGGGWDILPTSVDTVHNQITSSISHLSDFAGLADTTTAVSEGVFATLIVGRSITPIAAEFYIIYDQYVATFDSVYDPCNPVLPIDSVLVTCNEDTLKRLEGTYLYQYPSYAMPNDTFIVLGATDTFEITADDRVSALTESITFPDYAPYLTYPVNGDTLDYAGFNVTWGGSGGGVVELILMTTDTTAQQIIFEETPDDGSYYISGATLSGLEAGQYFILLNHYNRRTITAAGYDSRSFISGRVQSQALVYLP